MPTSMQSLHDTWNGYVGHQPHQTFMDISRQELGAEVTIEQAVTAYVAEALVDWQRTYDEWFETESEDADEYERHALASRYPRPEADWLVRALSYELEYTRGETWDVSE